MSDIQTAFSIRLKQYRRHKGATQQEVADFIGVDKTTYAHYEAGRRSPDLSRMARLAMYYDLTEELLGINGGESKEEGEEEPKVLCQCRFPVICTGTPIDMSRIYPTQQRAVLSIFNAIRDDERPLSVILFGSSTTLRCHKDSDLDLAVRLKERYTDTASKNTISEKIQSACGWRADILWFDRLSRTDRIYGHILEGVQIL